MLTIAIMLLELGLLTFGHRYEAARRDGEIVTPRMNLVSKIWSGSLLVAMLVTFLVGIATGDL